MGWFLKVYLNYAVFRGRARRAEFWYFGLWFVLFALCIHVLDVVFGWGDPDLTQGPLLLGFAVMSWVPSLAVQVRRLHDTGRSGWWSLINLVPLVGPILLLILLVQPGQAHANRFGPDPFTQPSAVVPGA